MAIARRLPDGTEPLFFTLSGAAPVVAAQGFEVEFAASYATPTAGSDWRWSRRLRGRLRGALREADPRVLVFDGAHPYQALLDALPAAPDAHRVWCRRPLWKPGANFGAIERTRFFDRVLEPGEFAAAEDRGATVARQGEANVVDPIVFLDDEELCSREDAQRELGIEPGGVCVLVQLGQGPEVEAANRRCLVHLAGRDDVRVVALGSALERLGDIPAGVVALHATYPISRFLGAFDATVAAAGYNVFHELIRFGPPSLHVPMRRQTDDQAARARYAERVGVGWAVAGPAAPELEEKLDEMLDSGARAEATARLAELRPANGAEDAAVWLSELADTERVPRPGQTAWKRYARHPMSAARAAAPFAARVPGALARIAHQTVTRPAAQVLIEAGGAAPDTVRERLPELLGEADTAPERVLVITERVDVLPLLREAGVGAEHLPAPDRRALILAERPRIRRTLKL
jgi:hypothetical protein